jgi:signal transduction histidine kinase
MLTDLRFNPYAVLSAITLAINLGLFIYFVRKPARTDERIWLSIFLGSLVVYAFGEMMLRLSATPHGAVFWTNVSDPGIIVPVALFLFALTYTNQSERRYPGTVAVLAITSLMMVFFLGFTDLIYPRAASSMVIRPWGYDFATNAVPPGLYLDLLWLETLTILALVRFISFRRHIRNEILRKQSLIFIWAVSIPTAVGTFTDLVLPSLDVNILPPLYITLFTVGACLFIYGIRRYQFLTISPTIFSHTILGTMQEAVVATDSKFNVMYQNPVAETVMGHHGSGQLALTSVLQPSALASFQQAFASSADTVNIDQLELTPLHHDPLPVRLTASRLRLGDYDTWVMILTDITKELQTRSIIEHEVKVRTRELHEARAYLISSINSIEQGFMLVNKTAQIELVNTAANRLWRVKDLTAGGKVALAALPKLDWDIDLAKVVGRVLETHHHRHQSAATADGSFYEVYVTPVMEGDSILGAAVVIEDVTEQRILDRSKDEFFSIASHELRTPLTAIRGNMSMLKDYYPDAMKDEGIAGIVNDSHSASVRLIEIVNDFLDSSSLEQGKMQFAIAPVDLAPLVANVVTDLKPILDGQTDAVNIEKLSSLPPVAADEARTRQILYNLLSNAAKYSDHGTITISGEVDGKQVRLRIADTGKGISPENQKLLFHKFQQAGESILTRDNTKGTGLGLYISRLLATNMQGNVELEHTEVGKGSTFALTLPIADARLKQQPGVPVLNPR